jgi:hypothetical protein
LSGFLANLLTLLQYIPTAAAALAFILSFDFPWTKLGVDDKKKKADSDAA